LVPSLARSLVTVLSVMFVTQMLPPSKATFWGFDPTANEVVLPSLVRISRCGMSWRVSACSSSPNEPLRLVRSAATKEVTESWRAIRIAGLETRLEQTSDALNQALLKGQNLMQMGQVLHRRAADTRPGYLRSRAVNHTGGEV
jgi:hypothetical protein